MSDECKIAWDKFKSMNKQAVPDIPDFMVPFEAGWIMAMKRVREIMPKQINEGES